MTAANDPMRGIDAELIAKVLEGRASADERRRVLAAADESPELLALLADSAAAIEEEATPGVVPLVAPARRLPRGLLVALAAIVVFAMVIPGVLRSRDEAPALSTAFTAPELMTAAARSGAQLSSTRGADEAEHRERSARLGARVMDYLVLVSARDTGAVTAAIEITAALRAIDGGGVAAARLEAAQSGDPASALPGIVVSMESVVDEQVFRRAAWLELARLASVARDGATLRRDDLRQAIEAMARDRSLAEEARASASGLIAVIRFASPDWAEAQRLSVSLLGELGR